MNFIQFVLPSLKKNALFRFLPFMQVRWPAGGQGVLFSTAILVMMISGGAPLKASDGITQPRPYMLFPADSLQTMRERFDLPRNRPVKEKIIADADRYLTYSGEDKFEGDPATFASRSYKTWAQKRGPARKAFLWAYLLTGDERYSQALLQMYRHEWKQRAALKQADFGFELNTKSDGVMGALAYDALWSELSEEDRQAFRTYLEQYLVFMPKPSFGWKNNIGTGYFAAVGSISLALLNESPQAREVLRECLERLKKHPYPTSFEVHPDGAYPECALYMDYMFLNLLPFIESYERITGDRNHGLLDPAFFQNTNRFVSTMLGGDGIWISFYDSQPQDFGAAWMAFLGRRTGQPLLLWGSDYFFDRILADSNAGSEVTRSLIPNILIRDWDKAHPFPGLPTLALLPSINTGSMRSDGTVKPGLMVAVRGYGQNEENMRAEHKDVGSFVLYARGENFLIDPGYYQPEAEAHSLPDLDGIKPQKRRPSPLTGAESGDMRVLSIDPSAAYKAPDRSAPAIRRTWTMDADRAVVLLDDVGGNVPVLSRFQAGYKTSLQDGGDAARVEGRQADLWIQHFGPRATLSVQGPLDFGKSWIYKKRAKDGLTSWHRLEAAYTASTDEPTVWVFVPLDKSSGRPEITMQRSASYIRVSISGRQAARFVKDSHGWHVEGVDLKAQ